MTAHGFHGSINIRSSWKLSACIHNTVRPSRDTENPGDRLLGSTDSVATVETVFDEKLKNLIDGPPGESWGADTMK